MIILLNIVSFSFSYVYYFPCNLDIHLWDIFFSFFLSPPLSFSLFLSMTTAQYDAFLKLIFKLAYKQWVPLFIHKPHSTL